MARDGDAAKALATAFCRRLWRNGYGCHHIDRRNHCRLCDAAQSARVLCRLPADLLQLCRYGRRGTLKTIASLLIGLILATVGMDTVSGEMRLTYGTDVLVGGVSFLAAVVGLFGIGELLVTVEEGLKFEGLKARMSWRTVWETARTMPRHAVTLVRSTVIGCWMGITPGGPGPQRLSCRTALPSDSPKTLNDLAREPRRALSRLRQPTIIRPAYLLCCRCWLWVCRAQLRPL